MGISRTCCPEEVHEAMTDIGRMFREARERKGVTVSEAAAATRMKVQHIEAIERNDFDYMPAPIYTKGFLRIYAEYLGLDPERVIREYLEQYPAAPPTPPPAPEPKESRAAEWKSRWRALVSAVWQQYGRTVQRVAAGVLIAVVIVSLMAGLIRYLRRLPATEASSQLGESPWPLLKDPPDLFLEEPTSGGVRP